MGGDLTLEAARGGDGLDAHAFRSIADGKADESDCISAPAQPPLRAHVKVSWLT